MDTYRQPEQVMSPAVHTDIDAPSAPRKGGFLHTVFSTNWGFVLIGVLVAIGYSAEPMISVTVMRPWAPLRIGRRIHSTALAIL